MADEADHAHEMEQLALEQALARRMPGPKLTPTGFCHFCREPLKPIKDKNGVRHDRIFCDSGCSEDFEAESWARQQRRI